MSTIKLRDPVIEERTVQHTVRAELRALQCDACGSVYELPSRHRDNNGVLRGTFDKAVQDSAGNGLGNMFNLHVCSFACAEHLVSGGWRTLKSLYWWKLAKAEIERAELLLTFPVLSEADIVKRWEEPSASGYIGNWLATPDRRTPVLQILQTLHDESTGGMILSDERVRAMARKLLELVGPTAKE